MSAQPTPRLTPEEYLAIERAAEFKSEYYDGQVFAMSGGTFPHVLTISNLSRSLGNALAPCGCRVLSSDLRVRAAGRAYCYPDVAVVCEAPRFADDQKDTLLNPIVLVEVLSKSTEAHDRGLKFTRYRLIESLQEYVLVSQVEPRIEVFQRGPGAEWIFRDFSGLDARCHLASLACDVPLAAVYEGVPFEA
jgi:Uma2 family endonuclease